MVRFDASVMRVNTTPTAPADREGNRMSEQVSESSTDVLNLMQESVVLLDCKARIVHWNAAAQALYGRDIEEVRGQRIDAVLPTRGGPSLAGDDATAELDGWQGAVERIGANGTDVTVRICCTVRRAQDGAALDIVETGVDITAQRLAASEQRYRKLFQFVPVSLIQIDRTELANHFAVLRAQGVTDLAKHIEATPGFVEMALHSIRIVEVNWKTVELFGAHDATQLLGPVARLWTESCDTFQRSMQTVYSGGASFQSEIRIRTFTGQVMDVLYVTDFPEAASEPALGLACLVDISERVRAQQALAKTQAEFAHAARVSVLGELTASIVHEVNQPLCAVLNNAEAALRWIDRPQPNLDEVRTLSTRIIRDVSRAAEIVQRIRALAGGKEPERLPVELNRMIEEVMVFLSPELARQNVEATLELDPQQPCVLGDRVQLQQVLVNIAVNAIHAMATRGLGARRLVIRTRNDDPSLVRVELEDTGPGIAADHLDHLFKSFFTTKADGMGIGLAICRSIIDAHGGRITAENLAAPGGARFSFSLPACV